MRLRYSDPDLFERFEPDDLIARLVYDIAEQIRCEALVPDYFDGVQANIETAFRAWCEEQEMTETALGLLIYTVIHMIRSRLVHPLQNELIEDTIESTRASISPFVGTPLRALKSLIADQAGYAQQALELARSVAALIDESDRDTTAAATERVGAQLFIPPEWGQHDPTEGDASALGAPTGAVGPDDRALEHVGGYCVYTRAHDVETDARTLYSDEVRRALRLRLDELIDAQAVSVFTLARRIQRLLAGSQVDGWSVGREDGLLDSHRLSQIVASPMNRNVFKQERFRVTSPAVVTFLIDNSGSMKRQRHETVTVLVDTLVRALDLAGATSEVLGFTTASWNGGEALREWRRAGEPAAPGRLAEVNHIVYKDADTPWRRSRTAIAAMMKTQHFREGIDGEAIAWAYHRLIGRPEPRKLLVVVSDGAPMEAATMNANGEVFLEAHLANVLRSIEHERVVSVGAIAIDQPVDALFSRSVEMDLTGTLTLGNYAVMEQLFPRRS